MCQNDDTLSPDCSLVDCVSVLSEIHLYILNQETKENVFKNELLVLDDFIIKDESNTILKTEIRTYNVNETDLYFISHSLVFYDNFKEGSKTYNVTLKDNIEFTIKIEAEYNTQSECCTGPYLHNIEIKGITHNLEHSIYYPIIYVE